MTFHDWGDVGEYLALLALGCLWIMSYEVLRANRARKRREASHE